MLKYKKRKTQQMSPNNSTNWTSPFFSFEQRLLFWLRSHSPYANVSRSSPSYDDRSFLSNLPWRGNCVGNNWPSTKTPRMNSATFTRRNRWRQRFPKRDKFLLGTKPISNNNMAAMISHFIKTSCSLRINCGRPGWLGVGVTWRGACTCKEPDGK